MAYSITVQHAYDGIVELTQQLTKLHQKLNNEKKYILGEVEAITSIKYEVLHTSFSAMLSGKTPDQVVEQLERWGFGATPRKALVENRTVPDEALRRSLLIAKDLAETRLEKVDSALRDSGQLAQKAEHVLTTREQIEAFRTAASFFKHPELTTAHYAETSTVRYLVSPSYRRVIKSLRAYEKENGNLLEKVDSARRITAKYQHLLKDRQDALLSRDQTREALSKFEAAIIVPVSDSVFIARQLRFATSAIVDADEFPKQTADAIIADHPEFVDVVEKFAKLQAQSRYAREQVVHFKPLYDAVESWQEKLVPAYNKLARHRTNKKATVALDLYELDQGVLKLERSIDAALGRLRHQRDASASIMSLEKKNLIDHQYKNSLPPTTTSKSDSPASSSSVTTSTPTDSGSSNFWLYYWMLSDNASAAPLSTGHASGWSSTSPVLDVKMPEVTVDTTALDSLNDIDVSTGGSDTTDSAPSSCSSSCSSGGGCGD